jgi:hypothetical protein
MAKDDKKTAAPKKEPAVESKTESVKTEGVKTEAVKAEGTNTEAAKADPATTDAAPKKQGMGEGQKPVTQAYKDNWNAIFGKKKNEKKKKR